MKGATSDSLFRPDQTEISQQASIAQALLKEGTSMETFMTAYLVVWFAVVLYVGRIGLRQRRLQQTLDALEIRTQQLADDCKSPGKAA